MLLCWEGGGYLTHWDTYSIIKAACILEANNYTEHIWQYNSEMTFASLGTAIKSLSGNGSVLFLHIWPDLPFGLITIPK
jgi:hypothetical protein